MAEGFIIYLREGTVIWEDKLPRGVIHDPVARTLRSEKGRIGRSGERLSAMVEGRWFTIGTRLVDKITDLKGTVLENNA